MPLRLTDAVDAPKEKEGLDAEAVLPDAAPVDMVAVLAPKDIAGAAAAAETELLVSCLASPEDFAPMEELPPPKAKAGAEEADAAMLAALEADPREKLAAGADDIEALALAPVLAAPNEKLDEPVDSTVSGKPRQIYLSRTRAGVDASSCTPAYSSTPAHARLPTHASSCMPAYPRQLMHPYLPTQARAPLPTRKGYAHRPQNRKLKG